MLRSISTFTTTCVLLAHVVACEPRSDGAASSDAPTTAQAEDRVAALRATVAMTPPQGEDAVSKLVAERQAAAKSAPKRADLWSQLGEAWVQKSRNDADPDLYEHADAAADVALSLDPDHLVALNLKGLTQMDRHEFVAAKEYAQKVLALDGDDPMALGTLSDANIELGDYDASIAAAQKMLDRKPNLPSYARASYLKWLHGDTAAAKELARLAHDAGRGQRDPEPTAWVLSWAADIFAYEGDYEGAMAGYDLALQSLPDYPPALAGKGRMLLARGDAEGALDAATRSLEGKFDVRTAHTVAAAHRALDQTTKAAQILDRIAADDDRLAASVVLATTKHDTAKAVELARREHDRRQTIWTKDALAWALHRHGDSESALPLIREAVVLKTPDPVLRYHHGAILIANGEREEGRKIVREVLASSPKFDPILAPEAVALTSE